MRRDKKAKVGFILVTLYKLCLKLLEEALFGKGRVLACCVSQRHSIEFHDGPGRPLYIHGSRLYWSKENPPLATSHGRYYILTERRRSHAYKILGFRADTHAVLNSAQLLASCCYNMKYIDPNPGC